MAPSIQAIADITILEDQDTTFAILSNDPDGDVLTFTVLSDNQSVKATLRAQESNANLNFDGTDDHVSFDYSDVHDFDGEDEATLSAWVKIDAFDPNDSNGGTQRILAKRDGYYLAVEYVNGNPKFDIRFKVKNTDGLENAQSTTTPIVNTWYHVAATYKREANKEDNQLILYVNGTAEGINSSIQSNNTLESAKLPLHFGALRMSDGSYNSHLDGSVDEVAIWNDALTASEITAIYNSGAGLNAASNSGNYTSAGDLAGYWRMNEGTGNSLTDESGKGNTGTINGASWENTSTMPNSINNTITLDPDPNWNGSATISATVKDSEYTHFYFFTYCYSCQ